MKWYLLKWLLKRLRKRVIRAVDHGTLIDGNHRMQAAHKPAPACPLCGRIACDFSCLKDGL